MMEERLARIETLLQHLTEKVTSHQADNDARCTRMERTLFGDGNGYRGMLVRMDRLEQDAERRTWRERAIVGAMILLVAKQLFEVITH
jgi:hypothetical protein